MHILCALLLLVAGTAGAQVCDPKDATCDAVSFIQVGHTMGHAPGLKRSDPASMLTVSKKKRAKCVTPKCYACGVDGQLTPEANDTLKPLRDTEKAGQKIIKKSSQANIPLAEGAAEAYLGTLISAEYTNDDCQEFYTSELGVLPVVSCFRHRDNNDGSKYATIKQQVFKLSDEQKSAQHKQLCQSCSCSDEVPLQLIAKGLADVLESSMGNSIVKTGKAAFQWGRNKLNKFFHGMKEGVNEIKKGRNGKSGKNRVKTLLTITKLGVSIVGIAIAVGAAAAGTVAAAALASPAAVVVAGLSTALSVAQVVNAKAHGATNKEVAVLALITIVIGTASAGIAIPIGDGSEMVLVQSAFNSTGAKGIATGVKYGASAANVPVSSKVWDQIAQREEDKSPKSPVAHIMTLQAKLCQDAEKSVAPELSQRLQEQGMPEDKPIVTCQIVSSEGVEEAQQTMQKDIHGFFFNPLDLPPPELDDFLKEPPAHWLVAPKAED